MRYAYPVTLARDADERVVASFLDVPEALTDGVDETEALAEAADALAAALAGYARERRPLPRPSAAKGRHIVPVPPLAAAKLALCEAMRRQDISNSELARRLGVTETVVRRLVDPDHASRIERVQAALATLGVELVVEEVA
jgi:antitoxin HicB